MRPKALTAALIPFVCLATGCTKRTAITQRDSVPETITQYGCPTCHVIPGIPGAVGKVGPSLDGLGQRSYLAGRLSNDESNLSAWLMHPQSIEPGVAMPEMGVTQDDARRIAAFLERSR